MTEYTDPRPIVRVEREGRFAGRHLILPDRRWGKVDRIVDFRIVGPRVLVKTERPPRGWRYYAIALTSGADKAAFPEYQFVGSRDESMRADVEEGTNVGILPDSIEALVLPSGAVVRAPHAPFAVLETPAGFLVRLRYATPKEDPQNLFLYDFDGKLRWQVGENAFGPRTNYRECFMDDRGRLVCTPFSFGDRTAVQGYEIDMNTGKVLSEVR